MARERDLVLDALQGLQDGVGREAAGQRPERLRRRLVGGEGLEGGADEHLAHVGGQRAHEVGDLVGGQHALGGSPQEVPPRHLGQPRAHPRPLGAALSATSGSAVPAAPTAGAASPAAPPTTPAPAARSTSPRTAARPCVLPASPESTRRRPSAERTWPVRMARSRSSQSDTGAGSPSVSSVSRTCEKSTVSTRTCVTPPAASSSASGPLVARGRTGAHRAQQRLELRRLQAGLEAQERDLAQVERLRQVPRVGRGQLLVGREQAVTGDAEGDGAAGGEQVLQPAVREGERGDEGRVARRVRGHVLPGDCQRADQFQHMCA